MNGKILYNRVVKELAIRIQVYETLQDFENELIDCDDELYSLSSSDISSSPLSGLTLTTTSFYKYIL